MYSFFHNYNRYNKCSQCFYIANPGVNIFLTHSAFNTKCKNPANPNLTRSKNANVLYLNVLLPASQTDKDGTETLSQVHISKHSHQKRTMSLTLYTFLFTVADQNPAFEIWPPGFPSWVSEYNSGKGVAGGCWGQCLSLSWSRVGRAWWGSSCGHVNRKVRVQCEGLNLWAVYQRANEAEQSWERRGERGGGGSRQRGKGRERGLKVKGGRGRRVCWWKRVRKRMS